MAKIPTYDTGVNPIAPLPGRSPERLYAEADSFGGGRGLSNLGAGLEDASTVLYDTEQKQEVSDVNTKMATLRGTLTASFEQRAAASKPGDTTFSESFMEDVTNQLADMGGTINTKAGRNAFAQASASLTSTFLEKSTSYQIASAGAKAVADFHTTVNQNAGTLFNDPTQFGDIVKSMDQNFNDPNSPFAGVPATEKSALEQTAKEQLAIAAARGVVRLNPDLADKQYNAGKLPGQDLLTEAGNAQVVSYIQTAQNAQRTKQALALAQQEHAQTMAAESAGNSIIKDIVKNPTDPSITDKILNSPMKWQQKEAMLEIVKHNAGPDGGHDQNTYGKAFYDLYQQVHAGQITAPDQLYKHVGLNGDLSVAGVDRLTAEIQGRRTPDGENEAQLKKNFVNTASKLLSGEDPLMHLKDPQGAVQQQKFLSWFLPAYDAAKADGKQTPAQLLDPDNPNGLWKGVQRFQRSRNQMMSDLMSANPAADIGKPQDAPTRITGDDDYKKLPSGATYIAPDGKTRTKK